VYVYTNAPAIASAFVVLCLVPIFPPLGYPAKTPKGFFKILNSFFFCKPHCPPFPLRPCSTYSRTCHLLSLPPSSVGGNTKIRGEVDSKSPAWCGARHRTAGHFGKSRVGGELGIGLEGEKWAKETRKTPDMLHRAYRGLTFVVDQF